MRRKVCAYLLMLSLTVQSAPADTIPAVNLRAEALSDPMISMARYESPVARQWMADVSLSLVGVGYAFEDRRPDADPQLGEGERRWQGSASTYLKHGTSTLWGGAAYDKGRQRNVQYNETADIDIVYPYVAADSVGGDISLERYALSGGYADTRGRLSWGASIAYKAGLYYRNVDPRPKNVTGRLDISVGVGYRVFRWYSLSLSLNLRRYTQSNDIAFRSEMGVEKVYHLTGLGNHYYRFAGQGLSAHYGGYRYGLSLDLCPASRRGLALSVDVSRFSFTKVLKDLNDLPLVSAWHNAFSARVSWLAPGRRHDWAVRASFDAYRRHGRENVFGDPSSNIYPLIGAQEMYADNHYNLSVAALYSVHGSSWRLWGRPEAGYSHRSQIYRFPVAERVDNRGFAALHAGASLLTGAWRLQAAVALRHEGHRGNSLMPSASASRALSGRYALQLGCRALLSAPVKSMDITAALLF